MRLPRLSVPGVWPDLAHVFSMAPRPLPRVYVDRQGLDRITRRAVAAGEVVAIHGASKQGKSWLVHSVISKRRTARAQCLPGQTADEVLELALGMIGVEAVTESSSAAEVSAKAAKASAGAQRRPLGEGVQSPHWVARQLRRRFPRRDRVLVLENFHKLDGAAQRALADRIRALVDEGARVIVVGIWTEANLLGNLSHELQGRVKEIRPAWSHEDLARVLDRGCRAMRVRLSPEVRRELVDHALGSVGMLHELAAALLLGAGVERPALLKRSIEDVDAVPRAVNEVLARVAPDYIPLLRELHDGLPADPVVADVGRALLRALVERDLLKLRTEGLPLAELEQAVRIIRGPVSRAELTNALSEILRLESGGKALAYDPVAELLTLDRRLLFLLTHGRSAVLSQLPSP